MLKIIIDSYNHSKELNLNLIKFNPFLQLILILIEKLKKKKILNKKLGVKKIKKNWKLKLNY